MSFRNLLVVNAGGVRTITVNRPDKLNALDRDTITELKVAFGAARDDDEVRAVVLTGAGPKAFVAGADITEFADATPVQEFHQSGQVCLGEVPGAHSRVEAIEPEVDRVRAVLDGRARAFPVARRGQQLGKAHGQGRCGNRRPAVPCPFGFACRFRAQNFHGPSLPFPGRFSKHARPTPPSS